MTSLLHQFNWKVVVPILVVVILIVWGLSTTQPFQDQETEEFFLTSEQFKFTPQNITVEVGTHVIFTMISVDVTHGFELPEFGVYNQQVVAGQNTTVEFTVDKTGEFRFYCTVFCGAGHSDHLGKLIVVE